MAPGPLSRYTEVNCSHTAWQSAWLTKGSLDFLNIFWTNEDSWGYNQLFAKALNIKDTKKVIFEEGWETIHQSGKKREKQEEGSKMKK